MDTTLNTKNMEVEVVNWEVGDKIVDFGRIHRIFKIKKNINPGGKKEDFLFYKPVYSSNHRDSLICSIPRSSTMQARIRKPVSPKKMDEALSELKNRQAEQETDVVNPSDYLKENDPIETAKLLRILHEEKKKRKKNLFSTKKTLYETAERHLTEELATVEKISLEEAKEEIQKQLHSK